MAKPDKRTKTTETQTTPKGAEIPVPKRSEFIKNLKKVAPAEKPAKRAR